MLNAFYARQLYRYGNGMEILSVCPGVTTRYQIKTRSDRDSWFSQYDRLEFLVSSEVIFCRWVRRFPSNKGIKEGYP